MLPQMVDPQQGLVSARKRCLRVVGRLGSTKCSQVHAMLLERVPREARRLVVADKGEEVDLGAKAVRMRGDGACAADEGARHQRGDDDGRIFLRHADGVAGDIFVDDQVADHRTRMPEILPSSCFERGDLETVPVGKIQRLADRGDVDIGIAFEQRQRGEPQFARGENQPAAIGIDRLLLRIERCPRTPCP